MSGVSQPQVSILIVSYNTRELTLEAVTSVARETRAAHEIIVVDNGSTDGSAEAIAQHPANVQLIRLAENAGFGRANNIAATHARAPYLLLLNSDTVVLFRAIDRLLEFAADEPAAGIWGGRTLFRDGSLNPSSCWQRITLWNLACRASGLTGLFPESPTFNAEAIGGWPRDSVRRVDIVSGCFLLTRADLWRQLGGFDPSFFMYGEEADLCLRARRHGAAPMATPAATIIHLGGASETTRTAKMVKLLAAKTSLIERHMSPLERLVARPLLQAWPLSRWIALSIAARLTREPHHVVAARAWGEVWRRRDEWRRGYPKISKSAHDAPAYVNA